MRPPVNQIIWRDAIDPDMYHIGNEYQLKSKRYKRTLECSIFEDNLSDLILANGSSDDTDELLRELPKYETGGDKDNLY